MTEEQQYKDATRAMNEKGRHKLANYMAHGYTLLGGVKHALIVRDGRYLAVDNCGNMWKLEKAI